MANHQGRIAQPPTKTQDVKSPPLIRWVGVYRGEDGRYHVLSAQSGGLITPLRQAEPQGVPGDRFDAEHRLKVALVEKILDPLENEE